MGQLQGDGELFRGLEGNRPLHRQSGDTRGPGEDAAVGHKGAQAQFRQLLPDVLLIFCQIGYGLKVCTVRVMVEQRALYTPGKEIEQDLFQLSGVDGTAVGREAHLQPQEDVAALRRQGAGGPLQHLLPAAADGD